MSDSHPSDSAWRKHEKVISQFESAWQRGAAPEIDDYLAGGNDADRTYCLRELIVIDLEYRCRQGEQVRIEDYRARLPELGDPMTLPLELIKEELRIRRACDRFPSWDELQQRFPSRVAELRELFVSSVQDADRPTLKPAVIDPGRTRTLAGNGPACAAPEPDALAAPSQLGRYQLREELGRGAFAVVYRAWDPELQREVAIKVPRAGVGEQEAARARMVREAQAAARLQHPGIVPIHEVGTEPDQMYIVYELVDGPTLAKLLQDRRPSFQEAVQWSKQIAEALHYAHQCGVVHRDIKPANIIMDSAGRPLLADFGLAHQEGALKTLTHEGDLLGTPAYMSPEQARGMGHLADARSDVYSLGVVLHELLCGRLPFEGDSALILQRIQTEDPKLPRAIPRDLRTITLKCLEKEPSSRYPSALELSHDLHRNSVGQPIHARPVGPSERLWKWSRRHPRLAALTAAVLLLAGVVIGSLFQLRDTGVERDRAVKAEQRATRANQEKQQLLADSYASAGLLAMQRGKMHDALAFFDRSLEQGYADSIRLRLSKVAAWVALHDASKAADEVKELALRSDLGGYEGEVLLWQAEFELASDNPGEDAMTLFRQAHRKELSAADRAYAEGMLAETSPQAVDRFRDVLDIDPFHHRARGMLINLLFTLGRVDEAQQQLAVGKQLFPENRHLKLMEGLTWAAQGNMPACHDALMKAKLDAADETQWRNMFQQLDQILQQGVPTDQPLELLETLLRDTSSQQLLELFRALSHKPNASGLLFPPRIRQKFERFGEIVRLVATSSTDKAALREDLEEIVRVHPEGSLYYFLGEIQIADDDLVAARSSFRASISQPSLLRRHQQLALVGVAATSIYLASVQEQDPGENLQHAVDAIRSIDLEQVMSARECRTFTITALNVRDLPLGRAWLEKWRATPGADLRDALRNLISLEFLEGDHVAALAACDKLLELDPQHAYALEHRGKALRAIAKVTEDHKIN